MTYSFIEPKSISEAETRIFDLSVIITDISAQLAQGTFRHPETGELQTPDEHKAWRARAIWRKRCAELDLKFLRNWLKRKREELTMADYKIDPLDPTTLAPVVAQYLKLVPQEARDDRFKQLWNVLDILIRRTI